MRKKSQPAICGVDVLEAIRNLYLDGIVTDDVLYDEDSYYDEIREEIRAALGAIKGADLLYDRPPEGRPHWNEGSDPEEDPPDWEEEASSYDLFFFALRGEQFEFEGELEEEDMPEDGDEPVLVTVPTVGKIGCAVGISLLAPFAVISESEMEFAESGSGSFPDICAALFEVDGPVEEPDAQGESSCRKEMENQLHKVQEQITRVLSAFGIRVLSEHELRARIPGLKPDPARNFAARKTATVGEALFFATYG